jgi:hypothetical protein
LPVLFDHFVGAVEQRQRHGEAERLGGPEIDHQFELSDFWFLSSVNDYFTKSGKTSLIEKMVLTPAGGAGKVSYPFGSVSG